MKWIKPVVIIAVAVLLVLFGARFVDQSTPAQNAPEGLASAPSEIPVRTLTRLSAASGSAVNGQVVWTGRSPAAKRAQKISIDSSWMTPEPVLKVGDRIALALFDDVVFDAQLSNVTRYPNGGVGMTAHLPGGKGTVYLSYYEGHLTASIETSSGSDFSIEYRNGVHYAVEIDRANSEVLEGAEPQIPSAQDIAADTPVSFAATASSIVPGAPDGSTIIDVMVVYTPAAKSWAATNNGIVNIINSAMQRANTAHTNSNTQVYLNLVHSGEVNYTESGSGYSQDLDRLTALNDGDLDEVHTLREQYRADLVCLLEKIDDAGGAGWLLSDTNGTPSHAFCIVRVQQTSWTYTMVHEWGHNMGCNHSKTQTVQPGPGLYSYSAGWQWDDLYAKAVYEGEYVGYCSIMTYEDFDDDGKQEYLRVPYFSNPSISYQSQAEVNLTGDAADGDNARTIRNVRSVLAAYRKAPDVDYDGLPNEWELQYFGGETNAVPTATASNGVNTVWEAYVAGLNPTSSASFFKITTNTVSPAGFVVQWNSVSGRVYSVSSTSNLLNSFQALETNIAYPQASYTDSVEHVGQFYEIGVQLAP